MFCKSCFFAFVFSWFFCFSIPISLGYFSILHDEPIHKSFYKNLFDSCVIASYISCSPRDKLSNYFYYTNQTDTQNPCLPPSKPLPTHNSYHPDQRWKAAKLLFDKPQTFVDILMAMLCSQSTKLKKWGGLGHQNFSPQSSDLLKVVWMMADCFHKP